MRNNVSRFRSFIVSKRKGFTLIEVCLSMALIGFILMAISPSFLSMKTTWSLSEKEIEYRHNSRIALHKMVSELKQAKEIVSITLSNNPNGRIVFMDKNNTLTEFVREKLNSTYVLMYKQSQSDILSGPIDALVFEVKYEDGTSSDPVKPGSIKSVGITLIFGEGKKSWKQNNFEVTIYVVCV